MRIIKSGRHFAASTYSLVAHLDDTRLLRPAARSVYRWASQGYVLEPDLVQNIRYYNLRRVNGQLTLFFAKRISDGVSRWPIFTDRCC